MNAEFKFIYHTKWLLKNFKINAGKYLDQRMEYRQMKLGPDKKLRFKYFPPLNKQLFNKFVIIWS